jgi:hypothetical protein
MSNHARISGVEEDWQGGIIPLIGTWAAAGTEKKFEKVWTVLAQPAGRPPRMVGSSETDVSRTRKGRDSESESEFNRLTIGW